MSNNNNDIDYDSFPPVEVRIKRKRKRSSLTLKKKREMDFYLSRKLPCDFYTLYATYKTLFPDDSEELVKRNAQLWVDSLPIEIQNSLILESRYEVEKRKKMYNLG